jgi:hypothetical protein
MADRTAVQGTRLWGWFRVLRDGPATFIITVGVGGTDGWRDPAELAGATTAERAVLGMHSGVDTALFDLVRAEELRQWWRVEWSSAVGGADINLAGSEPAVNVRYNSLKKSGPYVSRVSLHAQTVNQGGTFAWIQALRQEPDAY